MVNQITTRQSLFANAKHMKIYREENMFNHGPNTEISRDSRISLGYRMDFVGSMKFRGDADICVKPG